MNQPDNNSVFSLKVFIYLLLILILSSVIFFLYRYNKIPTTGDSLTEVYELPVKVRVLNGFGARGIAGEYSNYLMRLNIDVVGTGNTEKFIYDKSIIVVKKRDSEYLDRLKSLTNIRRSILSFNDNVDEDYQIIIGRDIYKLLD